MYNCERRRFLTSCLGLGGVGLYGGVSALAAEIGEAATSLNRRDTIAQIELFRIKSIRRDPSTPYFWIRITTANGLEGFGECYSVETTARWLSQYMKSLEGRNVSNLINRFYLKALDGYDPHNSHRLNMGWGSAVSCLEIAIWDLLGKMANQPIHVLLGGAIRNRVPLYANHAVFKGKGPPWFERILKIKELGFDMFKWDPFRGKPSSEREIRKQLEPVEKVRDALGADFKIAIDAHARWDNLEGPKIAAKAMEPLGITFFEEPFSHSKIELHDELAKSTSIPIASGEHMTHLDEVRDLVSSGGISYFQPEVGNLGGISSCNKACAISDAYNVKVSTHNWCGPIGTLATLQLTSVIPNLFRQEWPHLSGGEDWEISIVAPALKVENGHLILPQEPGIGAVPDIDRLKGMSILL